MRFTVLTLFPDFFDSPLKQSIIGRAASEGLIEIETLNIRDFTTDKHNTVDNSPYGGGPGMVMKPEPVVAAIEAVEDKAAREDGREKVILLTPQGAPFDQKTARSFSTELESVILVCGRYEGFDERIRDYVDIELSIGDYVLTGGEYAALIIIDAVGRLVTGVIKEESTEEESFSQGDGLLEYPQYTRPELFRGEKVPDVLLSGHHKEIEKWRAGQRLKRTTARRPELLKK